MKNTYKAYEENGVRYRFASKKLLMQINQKKHNAQSLGEKITKAKIMNEIAEQQCVSVEAVKNWMYGYNGPSDMEQVIKLGMYFDINYHELLEKEEDEMAESNKITGIVTDWQAQYTKERIREIYRAILNYIERCKYYYQRMFVQGAGTSDEVKKMGNLAEIELNALYNNANSQLEHSMLDIPEDMYEKVEQYLWTELSDYIDIMSGTYEQDYEEPDPGDEMEENSETDPEIEHWMEESDRYLAEFFGGRYRKDLRELFEDYIVK